MELPEVGWSAFGQLGSDVVKELIHEALLADCLSQLVLGCSGRVTKVRLERSVLWAQFVFVNVAILDDQRRNALRLLDRKSQADLRAKVVEIEREPINI